MVCQKIVCCVGPCNMLVLHQVKQRLDLPIQMTEIKTLFSTSAIVLGLIVAPGNSAHASNSSCSIVDYRLSCADGSKKGEDLLEAMANPKSAENILVWSKPDQLIPSDQKERYRRSVERVRSAVQKHANRQFRNYRRKRIDAETYDQIRLKFEKAMETYGAAMKAYRATRWFDARNGKKAEETN